MELELKKERLDTYELAGELTLAQEETAETIVPDYCPDIARIISAQGTVCLHGAEAAQRSVSGTVRVAVLYTPEGDAGVRVLALSIPFAVEAETMPECTCMTADTQIELLESRMLNPRKIFTRCKIVTRLLGYRPVSVLISCDAQAEPQAHLEQCCCPQPVSLLRQIVERDFTFSETMTLSLGRTGAADILSSRACGSVTETKIIGSKLMFKGVFTLSVLYRTLGGQTASAAAELPFSQIMEIDSIGEGAQVSVQLRLTGVDVQVDGGDDEGRDLSVTLYYHSVAFLREEREIQLLTDLYSTAYEVHSDTAQLSLCSQYDVVSRCQNVREVLEIGVAAEALVSVQAECAPVSLTREGDTAQLRTCVTVRALYLDEGGACLCAERCLDVACPVELPRECAVSAWAQCSQEVQGTLGDRGIEVRFPVDFRAEVCVQCRRLCVSAASLDETAAKDLSAAPSLVLRYVGKQESAWEVAKYYNTTIADILAANQLERESDISGDKLVLIPKKRA